MDNNNQPKRPPELEQPKDIAKGGENMKDDNLEELGVTTTFDLRQAAQEALAAFEKNGEVVDDDDEMIGDAPTEFTESMRLIFEVIGSSRMLTLEVKQAIIVGRSDSSDNFSAGLDLTEFGAYQLGLSRKHARIYRNGLQLELEDSGSRNGTFVNERKLEPHVPYIIHDGDRVRFGNMRVRLRFAQKA